MDTAIGATGNLVNTKSVTFEDIRKMIRRAPRYEPIHVILTRKHVVEDRIKEISRWLKPESPALSEGAVYVLGIPVQFYETDKELRAAIIAKKMAGIEFVVLEADQKCGPS